MAKLPKCSGAALPVVRLALEKQFCLRAKGALVRSSDEAVALVEAHYGCRPQEYVLGIFVSSANEVLAVQEVSVGGLDQAIVDPRALFVGAITAGATGLLLVHNHPSGGADFSAKDVALTKQLSEGARLLGIRLMDHILVPRGGRRVSMRENSAHVSMFSAA